MSRSSITYYAGGRKHRLALTGLFEEPQARGRNVTPFLVAPQRMGAAIATTLRDEPRLGQWFEYDEPEAALIAPVSKGRSSVIPTGAIVVESATTAVVRKLRKDHGAEVVREGRQGKVLVLIPGAPSVAVPLAADLSRELVEKRRVPAAYPNFVRVLQRPEASSRSAPRQWNLDNSGRGRGVIGADVHALAAWTITEGDPDINVAILDEGVDTRHSMLRAAVTAEADFVDDNAHARPFGDDAHGTACAGIVASRDAVVRGVAPGVSLVAARIAKSDAQGYWIFDDFETADAIDWCWRDAGADVLSNSWGGGAESDAIIRAVGRARQRGRGGKGSVVVFAAGNTQERIGFPADLDGVLTVGASNQWDERKTKNSQDGESWWGSNHGPELGLVAPGVSILTTDITGQPGYETGPTTATFNGTSSACPHAAAAAALVLSANPRLTEARVREILCITADPIGSAAVRNNQVGHGRLNCYSALRQARRG